MLAIIIFAKIIDCKNVVIYGICNGAKGAHRGSRVQICPRHRSCTRASHCAGSWPAAAWFGPFCTNAGEFGVITIDPTFTLGDFDVTPIPYRQLLLETKWNKQPPIFGGHSCALQENSHNIFCIITNLHVRRNIKDELNIPTEVANLMLDDMFGHRMVLFLRKV